MPKYRVRQDGVRGFVCEKCGSLCSSIHTSAGLPDVWYCERERIVIVDMSNVKAVRRVEVRWKGL